MNIYTVNSTGGEVGGGGGEGRGGDARWFVSSLKGAKQNTLPHTYSPSTDLEMHTRTHNHAIGHTRPAIRCTGPTTERTGPL